MAGLLAAALGRFPVLGMVPWRGLVVAAAAGSLFYAGWSVRGWREGAEQAEAISAARDEERRLYQLMIDDAHERQRVAEDLAKRNAAERDAIIVDRDRLQAAVRGLTLTRTTTTETRNESGKPCSCPDVRLGTAFRLCFNAAAGGDAGAIAACEALRVPSGVPGQ